MRLIGDYRITQDHSVAITNGIELLKPYLFLHPLLKDFDGSESVTIAPANAKEPHIPNGICPTKEDDGMLLWFCIASHNRFRVKRHHCKNAIILNSGEWGSTCIAISRDDRPAEIVFHKGHTVETARLERGVIVRTTTTQELHDT